LVVDAERISDRVDGITLLDDVDLAVFVVVVRFDVGAAGLFGTGEADLLADLEEASRLAASANGGVEIICGELMGMGGEEMEVKSEY
jgi:hypothetical protein